MGPNKAWGAQQDLGARYRPSQPQENVLSEALAMATTPKVLKLYLIPNA